MHVRHLSTLFGLRDSELALFSELLRGERLSASQLARRVNISRTSAYDLLSRLIELGLVYETLKSGVKLFATQPLKKIAFLLEEKRQSIVDAQKELKSVEKEYDQKQALLKPRFQLFEGRDELQQMMKDMLLYDDLTVHAFWPIKSILKILTKEFWEEFQTRRVANNISLKVIWPQTHVPLSKEYDFLRVTPELKREARIAPKGVDFSLGYAVYGTTVRFISSSKENFGFLIESVELTKTMMSQFNMIWKLSKKLVG